VSKQDHLQKEPHLLRRLVAVRKVGEGGLVQVFAAKADELASIAAFLEVESVSELACDMGLSRWRARGIKLTGHISAHVVQNCVVTLEPVEETISADFERKFLPEDMLGPELAHDEVFVDPVGEDPPEPLTNELDLGEIAVEEVALNLNPYPRKAGIEFEQTAPPVDDTPKANPFAALAKLKGKLEPKG
jgi:uncharacterized metal-binding protein YceD (DUF177 family)